MLINLNKKLVDIEQKDINKTVGECFVDLLNLPEQGLDKKKVKERAELIRAISISDDMEFELDQLSLISAQIPKSSFFITVQDQLYKIIEP